uniref:Protein SCAF11 n=1 Tax=Noccaea caerulescens TaxID=107243 RepID=A0A1J3JN51_NOCCA
MTSVTGIVYEQQVVDGIQDMALPDQENKIHEPSFGSHGGCCAICLNEIPLQETAMIKGCEHTYCVTCILRWASYKESPTCPQCKHPFDFLSVHRALDGCIEDFLFEESVCLLLRASWFIPLDVMKQASYSYGYQDDFDIPCDYEDEDDDDLEEFYMHGSSLRIGNRRWGDNGFVRSGRQEARPVQKHSGSSSSSNSSSSSGSSSCEPKDKQLKTANTTGRRAKRAMKRQAANKAAEVTAAAKHEAHLVRFGRK